MTDSCVTAGTYLFLRLPSELLKLIEVKTNSIIELGKLGSFPSASLLGRPYFYTYELLDKSDGESQPRLRIVPPSELHAETVADIPTPSESRDEAATPVTNGLPEGHDLLPEEAKASTSTMKNNRLTVDDASRQALTQQEIEELKKSAGGREIIEKIMAGHSALDEKTDFSKAKYTLRKTKKYLKRFVVLPMDLRTLIEYVLEKEASRILELREDSLGLMMAWGNLHSGSDVAAESDDADKRVGSGRWLAIDETGGLVVAAMAERMGILYPTADHEVTAARSRDTKEAQTTQTQTKSTTSDSSQKSPGHKVQHHDFPIPAAANTITLIHPAVQPNLSLLKYFGYDTNQPDPHHALHTHLKPLSWLQLLHPDEDPTYREPDRVSAAELQKWKSGRRGAYWKKRRRWERCRSIVDEAIAGGFDGLLIASSMDPAGVLAQTVPLIRGGGTIVVYSPTAEPLVRLVDLYSRDRRAAYMQLLATGETPDPVDFPVDPRLLLGASLQTSRVRQWQVLPGRTHPMMGSRGGAEGYVFTARRVLPLDGGVLARGNFSTKRRKVKENGS